MSGHSHWARIKHKKGATDAKRGRLWSKLMRAVILAARSGGDPKMNLKLEYAVEKAKGANVPKDTIERGIKKGTGELEGEQYEEVILEAYGPGGIAIIIEVLTDNRNRTVGEMRVILEKGGGNMAGAGAVSFQFERKGLITIDASKAAEDAVLEVALEHGAENVATAVGFHEVTCSVPDFIKLSKALGAKFPLESSDLCYVPTSRVPVEREDKARKLMNLLSVIDEHEDVQHVFANYEFSDEITAALETAE